MPIKKLVQDDQGFNAPENNLDSIKPVNNTENTIDSIKKPNRPLSKVVKKTEIKAESESVELKTRDQNQNKTENTTVETYIPKPVKIPLKFKYKNVFKLLSQIKPFYTIGLVLIILALIILFFIKPGSAKDPADQSRQEVETVKKMFSTHIILPENEQIDIRKITNKIEDPFFKDAEIGDYLIIFYKNRIAYIYSIDKDIIINAGVVFIDPKTATTSPEIQQ